MLAGSDDLIKPDRMIMRFLEAALNRSASLADAQELLKGAAELLQREFQEMTPRLLDYAIWNYQRSTSK